MLSRVLKCKTKDCQGDETKHVKDALREAPENRMNFKMLTSSRNPNENRGCVEGPWERLDKNGNVHAKNNRSTYYSQTIPEIECQLCLLGINCEGSHSLKCHL